ncbi:MAG: oligosaccharide flippase family protein, partial [bacterium]
LAATGTALGFVLSPHLSVWIWGNREFAPLVALSFLGVLTTAISNAIGALLQAARQFRTFAALQIFSPLLALIATATLLVSAALSVQSLIWITILVPLFTAGVGCINVKFFFPKKKEKNFRVWSLSLIAVRRLFAFSKWIFPAVAGGVLFSQLDLILARRWATSEAAGYYALALGLAMKAAVLNGSLETAFLPLAAEVKSATDLKRYRRSAFAKTAAASTLILAALPFTDFFIRIFYGETFRPATPLTQILLIMVLVNLNALPINLLAYPLDRPQWLALGQVGKALFFIMGARLAVATWGATGIAAAKLAAEILVAIFYLFLFRRAAFRFDSWRNFDERQIKTDRHSR